MSNHKSKDILICDDVSVRFPLLSPANRWQLFFGIGIETWHDALEDISLSVPCGKIIGVIGRNGAGKSTLLRTLAGIYSPFRGKVIRLGPVSALFELGGMGGVLITGRQYVLRWLRMNGVPSDEWDSLISEVKEFSELGDRFDDRIYTYSSGMASRLYFSTATSVGYEIYLIDEVLSVGDEHFQAKCWKRIRDRLAHGASGVLVTHDWSAILRLCERSCELRDGRIVSVGDSENIICGYLKLSDQLAYGDHAAFSDSCPTTVNASSGQRWDCDFPVEIYTEVPVFFNYSIEKLILGQDWQILFFGEETLVGTSSGKYNVRISISEFLLTAGSYRLNLFLNGARPAVGGAKPGYDIRSWTTGNSVKLVVDGPEKSGLVIMPMIIEET